MRKDRPIDLVNDLIDALNREGQGKVLHGALQAGLIAKANSMSDQVEAGMAWSDIASSAYRAYAASTGNKNFRGDPMPIFDDLPQAIKTAWEAAVRQADRASHYVNDPSGLEASEQRWAGWVPPHLEG